MKQIELKIKEIDKKGRSLTLFNFRDELVNLMYKKTVADSSRSSMRFYVLIFFLCFKTNGKTLLMNLFDENIQKIKDLNKTFEGKKRLLKGEYNDLVTKNGLAQIFKYDIFFILIASILESSEILSKFKDFFDKNNELKQSFIEVVEKYGEDLAGFQDEFKRQLITDDRYDEFGEYHDLSKSVYRTIKMRTSRQIDLSLHRYAEVKIVSSQSPIDLSIIQHIDPQIIFDTWETYRLGDYVKEVWRFANENLPSGAALLIADRWLRWKLTDGKKHRAEKQRAKVEFENTKNDNNLNAQIVQLASVLAESVIKSNDYLRSEVDLLRDKITTLNENNKTNSKAVQREVEGLKKRIERLDNITVQAKPRNKTVNK